MDRIEIDVRFEDGIQSLGLAWIARMVKEELTRVAQVPGSQVKEVGEVKIVRKVFSTKIA